MDNTTLGLLGALAVCVAFALGYLMARADAMLGLLRAQELAPRTISEDRHAPRKRQEWTTADDNSASDVIAIDERKFVTKIDTTAMALGSTADIGRTTTTTDTIQESVSKLSQLKGK